MDNERIENEILYLAKDDEYVEEEIHFIVTGKERSIHKLIKKALSNDKKGYIFLDLDKITPLPHINNTQKLTEWKEKNWKCDYAKLETKIEKKKITDSTYQLEMYLEDRNPLPIFEKLANLFPNLDFKINVIGNLMSESYERTYSLKRAFFISKDIGDYGDEYCSWHYEEETTPTNETYHVKYRTDIADY